MARDYDIESLTALNADDALQLTGAEFSRGSALHQALGIDRNLYHAHLAKSWNQHVEHGLSLVALDSQSGELLGCLIAMPYPTPFAPLESIDPSLRAIAALLMELEQRHQDRADYINANRLLVDLAVVKPSSRGRGVYSELRRVCHRQATEAGFDIVVGELTSVATQALCVDRLGHQIKAEIQFEEFRYQDHYPFASLARNTSVYPPSIQLVEGKLPG